MAAVETEGFAVRKLMGTPRRIASPAIVVVVSFSLPVEKCHDQTARTPDAALDRTALLR